LLIRKSLLHVRSPLEKRTLLDFSWHFLSGAHHSDASYYKWKAKFGGMDVSDAKRLKALEEENSKLKRLLADALLDNAALKDVVSRKW
jgi:hypothetical protein